MRRESVAGAAGRRSARSLIGVNMPTNERRLAYASLVAFALAFGFIEASVVVYLRELYAREASLHGPNAFAGLQVTLVALPTRLVSLEMAREACTIVLLGAVAWLAGRRAADRAGAFLLAFGAWDLTYYGVLRLAAGWPDTLGAWDILFLIPAPWVAPVWAPIVVAAIFAGVGTYLFWTSDRERQYGWLDASVLSVAVLLTIGAFLVESGAAIDHQVPRRFPVRLFWAGVGLGTLWFVRRERRILARRMQPPVAQRSSPEPGATARQAPAVKDPSGDAATRLRPPPRSAA